VSHTRTLTFQRHPREQVEAPYLTEYNGVQASEEGKLLETGRQDLLKGGAWARQ
jgi:hypothetical protein